MSASINMVLALVAIIVTIALVTSGGQTVVDSAVDSLIGNESSEGLNSAAENFSYQDGSSETGNSLIRQKEKIEVS